MDTFTVKQTNEAEILESNKGDEKGLFISFKHILGTGSLSIVAAEVYKDSIEIVLKVIKI